MNYASYPFLKPQYWWVMVLLTVWDLYWRGRALWKSAGNKQLYWFIALLLVNSVGILPIVYLVFFRSKNKKKQI